MSSSVTPGRAEPQPVADSEYRLADDAFFVYERTVGAVILHHDRAVATHERAMRARHARRRRSADAARAQSPFDRPADRQRLIGNAPGAALEQHVRRPQRRRRRFELRGLHRHLSRRAAVGKLIDERQRVRRPANRRFVLAARPAQPRPAAAPAIAQSRSVYKSLEQARQRGDALRHAQLDRHAGDARVLHEPQQLRVVRLRRRR